MTEKKEIQIAWEIHNLIDRFVDLLWDRYEEPFLDIYLREEEEKFLRTIEYQSLMNAPGKIKPSG